MYSDGQQRVTIYKYHLCKYLKYRQRRREQRVQMYGCMYSITAYVHTVKYAEYKQHMYRWLDEQWPYLNSVGRLGLCKIWTVQITCSLKYCKQRSNECGDANRVVVWSSAGSQAQGRSSCWAYWCRNGRLLWRLPPNRRRVQSPWLGVWGILDDISRPAQTVVVINVLDGGRLGVGDPLGS